MMLKRIVNFVRRRRAERELDEEIRSSADLLAEERAREGLPPGEARRQALIELGGIEQVKEEVRAVRGLPFVESVIRDFRYGLRSLIRTPGVSLAAALTLSLALGANAAIFTLLDRMVLRPLPVKAPSELVAVYARSLPGGEGGGIVGCRNCISYPLYVALRERVKAFAGMLLQLPVTATMMTGTDPAPVSGAAVSGSYFQLLGVKAAAGRLLTPDDDRLAANNPVVVLSHGFWERRFGGDPSVLNRTIQLNRIPMTVVGVAASGFTGTITGEAQDFFMPLPLGARFARTTPAFAFDSPNFLMYKAMARLAPGLSLAEAERAADAVYQQLLAAALAPGSGASEANKDYVKKNISEYRLTLTPAGYASSDQSALSRDLRTPLLLLFAMAGLALIVAAGNVANLFLARAAARSREIAIRFAIGASSWRVLRERAAESILLASVAGVFGLLLAHWTSSLTPVLLNLENLPDGVTTAPDSRTWWFTLMMSLAAGIGIWAASSWQVVRTQSIARAANASVRAAQHWRRALVIAQVSLSIVLLCTSAVLSRSLIRLVTYNPGFAPEDLYAFSLNPGQAGYGEARSGAFLSQALEQLGALPGVRRATFASYLPLASEKARGAIAGDGSPDAVGAEISNAGPGHFANLGARMTAGREFSREDSISGAKVAVINESLSRQLFGKGNPLGRLVGFGDGGPLEIRVIGVLKDVRFSPRIPVSPAIFRPYNLERDTRRASAAFALRTERGVKITREMVQAAVNRIDGSVAVAGFGSITGQISRTFYRDRMLAILSLAFAVLATVLCGIGIFGLTSFAVSRRVKEIAVRIALGATSASIRWMVMKEATVLAVLGCAAGLAVFAALDRILSRIAFEAAPNDPASAAIAAAVLGGAALLGALLPANRAARLDPAGTLRQD